MSWTQSYMYALSMAHTPHLITIVINIIIFTQANTITGSGVNRSSNHTQGDGQKQLHQIKQHWSGQGELHNRHFTKTYIQN